MTDPWLQVAQQDPWLKQAEVDPWLQEAQPELEEISVEPTAEDLEIYRRLGVKQYRSPAGKLYDLALPTEPTIKDRPGLISRTFKSFVNKFFSEPARTILTEGGIGEIDTALELAESGTLPKPTDKPRKFSLGELGVVIRESNKLALEAKRKTRERVEKAIPAFEVPPAETIPEKAIDVVAGVSAFIGRLLLVRKFLGVQRGDFAGSVVAWETENIATGGTPGTGAAMRLALGGIESIPATTLVGKTAKLGAQSSLFGGLTAAAGGDWEDIAIVALIPLGFKAWNVAGRGVAKGRARRAIIKLRTESKKYGINLDNVPDQALDTIINAGKQANFWNKQHTKGKVTDEVFEQRLGAIRDNLKPIFEAIAKQQPKPADKKPAPPARIGIPEPKPTPVAKVEPARVVVTPKAPQPKPEVPVKIGKPTPKVAPVAEGKVGKPTLAETKKRIIKEELKPLAEEARKYKTVQEFNRALFDKKELEPLRKKLVTKLLDYQYSEGEWGIESSESFYQAAQKAPPTPSALERKPAVETKDEYRARIKAAKPKPVDLGPAKEKEFEIEPGKFYTQAKIDEAITKGEMGEIEIEPSPETKSNAFNKHIDYFQSIQLPEDSKIRSIQKQMQVVNGKRLAGKISIPEANRKIQKLRTLLLQTAQKEGIALRMTKGGKVSVAVRKAGTYVPVEFAEYKRFKDIYPRAQDVTRSIQQIDGALSVKEKKKMPGQAGAAERNILWPTREMVMQKDRYIKEKAAQLKKILPVKKGSKEDTKINDVLEKIAKADRNKPIKDVLSAKTLKAMAVKPSTVKQAVELRKFYDDLIDEQNTARRIRDQEEIAYRRNYSPHILRDATIWERITMTGKTAKDVFGKKAPIPDYIRPNKPFNPREMARKAGIRYEERIKSATELAGRYLSTAAKDIFNTSIIQNNKAFIQQLEAMGYENPARYLADWTSQAYAGIMPSLDRALLLGETPKARKGMMKWNQVRNLAVFPLNVGWTLGTQIKSFAMTIGRYGSVNVTRGFYQWLKPSIRRQAAEDYYSFIVKSARQGKVTRQDAKNLIGEEVKLRRTKGELARDLTTLFLEEMEKLLTGASIRAAHLHGSKRGLTGEALKNYASDGGAKTQSMYNDEDKPLFLTNLTIKTVTPYQTYCYETMNTLREWAGRTGTPPDSKMYAVWSLVRYLAAMAVLNQIEASVRGRKWSWLRLIPLPFSELWLSPIYKHFTKEWLPGGSGLLSPVETASRVAKGIDDVLETGSWRKLRNELVKYGPGLFRVPGGVQWARLMDAIIAYSNGGVKDRRGRLLFKLDTPEDLARGMSTGVWTTKGGREYLEKRAGKKEEPRTRRALP